MEEIWKGAIYQGQDISQYVEVSNFGRLRNTISKHLYSLCSGGIGYLQICTTIFGKRMNVKVHKTLAETFIDNPDGKLCVNHKDGNKLNNNIDNLEWMTHKENSQHALNTGLLIDGGKYPVNYGESNGQAKLTQDDVLYIRKNYLPRGNGNGRGNRKELAEKFGVTPVTIYNVYTRKLWKQVE